MKTDRKKSFIAIIRSFGFALLTLVAATLVAGFLKNRLNGEYLQYLPLILYDLIISVCCFFIIRQNPGSILYVPIICNAIGIWIALHPEGNNGKELLLIYSGFILSLIISIIGARIGRKAAKGN